MNAFSRRCLGLQRKKIAWISFLVFDFCNTVSQTEILRQIADRDFDVYIFGMRSKNKYRLANTKTHAVLLPLRHIPLVSSTLYVFAMSLFLPFYVLAKKIDYIIVEPGTSLNGLILKLLLYPLRLKVVLDIRTTPIIVTDDFRERLQRLLFKTSIVIARKGFDGITILTKHMRRQICSEFSLVQKDVGVWTSGVSQDLFNPQRYCGKEMRKKFELDDQFIVFYHGLLGTSRMDGIIGVVKALRILRNRHYDLTFFLLGEGDGLPLLKKEIKENDLDDAIMIHEKVDYADVPRFIAMANLGIVPLPDSPNWRFQCPLKLLEYLAMGKVVVVTDIPANREVVGKCECGIYISSIDPNEIAEAIAYAYNNRSRLEEWGKLGRSIVEKNYTWTRVANDFENYLLMLHDA